MTGYAFDSNRDEEKHPLPLYNPFPADAVDYIENLQFTGQRISITFTNRDKKTVTKHYPSRLIKIANTRT